MGMLADYISNQLDLASIMPYPAIIVQIIILILIFLFALFIVPGFKFKITTFVIGFIGVVII